jgi:hypothetical protein
MNRQDIQSAYIEGIVENMSMKDLVVYAYDTMHDYYDKMVDEDLISEVKEYSPELIEGVR